MRYRAAVHFKDTNDLALDLGRWETKRDASAACMGHAVGLLTWDQTSPGIWQARPNTHRYQIVASLDSN